MPRSNEKKNVEYCKCFFYPCVMQMAHLRLNGILVIIHLIFTVVLFHTGWFVITQIVMTVCLLMQLGNLILQLYIWTRTSTESHTGTGKRRAPIKIVQTSLALTILSGQFFFFFSIFESIIAAFVRSTREGNVFTLSVHQGRRVPWPEPG